MQKKHTARTFSHTTRKRPRPSKRMENKQNNIPLRVTVRTSVPSIRSASLIEQSSSSNLGRDNGLIMHPYNITHNTPPSDNVLADSVSRSGFDPQFINDNQLSQDVPSGLPDTHPSTPFSSTPPSFSNSPRSFPSLSVDVTMTEGHSSSRRLSPTAAMSSLNISPTRSRSGNDIGSGASSSLADVGTPPRLSPMTAEIMRQLRQLQRQPVSSSQHLKQEIPMNDHHGHSERTSAFSSFEEKRHPPTALNTATTKSEYSPNRVISPSSAASILASMSTSSMHGATSPASGDDDVAMSPPDSGGNRSDTELKSPSPHLYHNSSLSPSITSPSSLSSNSLVSVRSRRSSLSQVTTPPDNRRLTRRASALQLPSPSLSSSVAPSASSTRQALPSSTSSSSTSSSPPLSSLSTFAQCQQCLDRLPSLNFTPYSEADQKRLDENWTSFLTEWENESLDKKVEHVDKNFKFRDIKKARKLVGEHQQTHINNDAYVVRAHSSKYDILRVTLGDPTFPIQLLLNYKKTETARGSSSLSFRKTKKQRVVDSSASPSSRSSDEDSRFG